LLNFLNFAAGGVLVAASEVLEDAVAGAAEVGRVAIEDDEDAGIVTEGAEREGGLGFVGTDGKVLLYLWPLAEHFEVEEGGFDGPDAIEAPAGGDQFVDEIGLDEVAGLELDVPGLLEGLEAVLGFAGEDDAGSGEAVGHRAERGAGAAFGCDRSVRLGAIGAIRINLLL
jgi:hypothetical protein